MICLACKRVCESTVVEVERSLPRQLEPRSLGLNSAVINSFGPNFFGSNQWVGGVPALAAGDYEPPLGNLLVALKDDHALQLAGFLAQLLAQIVSVVAGVFGGSKSKLCLVPIPSSAKALRRRGFDHMGMLANRASKKLTSLGLVTETTELLVQKTGLRDQSELGRNSRWQAKTGAMRLRDGTCVPKNPIILVDDVITTGATMHEAYRVLKENQAAIIGVVALAQTVKKT